MLRLRFITTVAFTMSACWGSERVVAGPYADNMAKCLVKAVSPEDRTLLVRWTYSVYSLHPDLASMPKVSTQQRNALARKAGVVFQRLILESCRSEAQQAVQNEAPHTLQYAYQILFNIGLNGLTTDPHVMEGVSSVGGYMDMAGFKAFFDATNSPPSPK
jgi:hypothetical protein